MGGLVGWFDDLRKSGNRDDAEFLILVKDDSKRSETAAFFIASYASSKVFGVLMLKNPEKCDFGLASSDSSLNTCAPNYG